MSGPSGMLGPSPMGACPSGWSHIICDKMHIIPRKEVPQKGVSLKGVPSFWGPYKWGPFKGVYGLRASL